MLTGKCECSASVFPRGRGARAAQAQATAREVGSIISTWIQMRASLQEAFPS